MVKLTQTVQKGGCAAKIAATELREILGHVKFAENSKNVIVDGRHMDDAGVIKINSELALVQTLDFFTPIVDSPYAFGQIAAANALSDVYAMGGVPVSAMAILAFPLISMEKEIIQKVLQGASDKISESKADFVGGHSIDDDTLKFGLSVSGYVHPEKIWKNSGAQVDDQLILIKALGTGTATAALKRQAVTEDQIFQEMNSMSQLNHINDLLDLNLLNSIHAATDITGFGLAGHLVQLSRASDKTIEIQLAQVPCFENTIKFLKEGFLTKAHRTNYEYIKDETEIINSNDQAQNLICDPQTSGGLLLSVAADKSHQIVNKLKARFPKTQIIGKVSNYDLSKRLIVL